MMKNSKFFNVNDYSKNDKSDHLGILLINDLSKKSEFMLQDWGLPVFRPISVDLVDELNISLNEPSSNAIARNLAIDDLINQVSEKINKRKIKSQNTYFIVSSFDENLAENFSLRYSPKANLSLLEPVEKNLSVSNQKFKFVSSHSNYFFDKMESVLPGVSCIDLTFGKLIENPQGNTYPKERVFEEILIFANLSFSGKI